MAVPLEKKSECTMTSQSTSTSSDDTETADLLKAESTVLPLEIEKNVDALEKGEEKKDIDLSDPKYYGFFLQYFAVGLMGGIPATVYGLFLGYLNVPGYVYATAGVIIQMPWSFKFVFGMLNDCLPFFGYRRKPYMVFGWTLCFAMLIFLSQRPLPDPYYCVNETTGYYIKEVYNPVTNTTEPADPCNREASTLGGSTGIFMSLATLGMVIADVAADAMMVSYNSLLVFMPACLLVHLMSACLPCLHYVCLFTLFTLSMFVYLMSACLLYAFRLKLRARNP